MRSLLASKLPLSLTPALATRAGSLSFPPTLRPLATLAGLGMVVPVVVLGAGMFPAALAQLRGLHPAPAGLAAIALIVTLAASAAAWRCALQSAGARLRYREAWGCYGLGSLANAVLPARLGEVVRIGLFARRLDHRNRGRVSAGACLAVAGARAAVYVLLCAAGAAAGVLPGWLLAVPLALVVPGVLCRRRLVRLGFTAPLFGWVTLAAVTRLAAGAGVLEALDVDNPLGSAFVGLTALAAASALPIAPGGIGLAGAGMALALQQFGLPASSAVAAAVAFHAAETVASVAFGSSGWLALRTAGPRPSPLQAAGKSYPHEVPALPRKGAANICAPGRGGTGGAARRAGEPME